MSRTSVHRVLFPTCHALKTWFELSRVKLYRNDLKGSKNYFELAGGSSYGGFELPRVKLPSMYERNPGEIDFGSSKHEVRVSEGSSYRESTVFLIGSLVTTDNEGLMTCESIKMQTTYVLPRLPQSFAPFPITRKKKNDLYLSGNPYFN